VLATALCKIKLSHFPQIYYKNDELKNEKSVARLEALPCAHLWARIFFFILFVHSWLCAERSFV